MCWIKVGDFGAKRDGTSIGRLVYGVPEHRSCHGTRRWKQTYATTLLCSEHNKRDTCIYLWALKPIKSRTKTLKKKKKTSYK